jgi:hypothetical protein
MISSEAMHEEKMKLKESGEKYKLGKTRVFSELKVEREFEIIASC